MEDSKASSIRQNKISQKVYFSRKERNYNWKYRKCQDIEWIFSSAVKNLKIPRFHTTDLLVEHISHPALKAISKFQNHPSLFTIWSSVNGKTFRFSPESVTSTVKEIKVLHTRKAILSTGIPIKVLEENADIFGDYICLFFNK